jgi:hypothetical protein
MKRLLRWFPVAWAGGVYLALLWLPAYRSVQEAVHTDGSAIRTTGQATLAAVNGRGVYLTLAVPVLAALVAALPWPARFRRLAAVGGAVIAGAFVVLGMASVGLFFLPSALGLIGLALAARPSSRPAT